MERWKIDNAFTLMQKNKVVAFSTHCLLDVYLPRFRFSLVVSRGLVFFHGPQLIQFAQAIVDERPDAILVDVNFALAVIGSPAGAVDQALVAVGYRTNAAGLPDDAGAALGADFIKGSIGRFFADEDKTDGNDSSDLIQRSFGVKEPFLLDNSTDRNCLADHYGNLKFTWAEIDWWDSNNSKAVTTDSTQTPGDRGLLRTDYFYVF